MSSQPTDDTPGTAPGSMPPDDVDFGFETVRRADKAGRVRQVFDRVAGRYDLMNDLMSFGVHRLWKDEFVALLNPQAGKRYLDVAGGTGDIAFRIQRKLAERDPYTVHKSTIFVSDINEAMLREGREREKPVRGDAVALNWLCGNAETLPLPDRCVDYYTIAFGIRNVTNIDLALAEAFRVLKIGGRFQCLEFSKVDLPLLDKIYRDFSFHVLPHIGQAVAGDRAPYDYLVQSIEKFPDAATFLGMVEEAGFARCSVRKLSGGICAIHSGWRL